MLIMNMALFALPHRLSVVHAKGKRRSGPFVGDDNPKGTGLV